MAFGQHFTVLVLRTHIIYPPKQKQWGCTYYSINCINRVGTYSLRYPWDAWKFKLPLIPRFYFAKIPWDGWKFKLPRIPRFFGKIKPWPSWKFELPRWSRFYFAKKPWDAWKFKLPRWSRFYGKIKPWDAWKFKGYLRLFSMLTKGKFEI